MLGDWLERGWRFGAAGRIGYGPAGVRYLFDSFELDPSTVELRHDGAVVALEPQVFALLLLLVENRERLVSRDEIIEKVWDGRVVSDSAIDSRIKSARKALGDDGDAQRCIRTVRGQGFRFVGEVREAAVVAAPDRPEPSVAQSSRPSIAVLPLQLAGADETYARTIADALPDELIAELSRLHWLFVIARGSSFRFRSPSADLVEVGRILGVRYCLTGMVAVTGKTLSVTVQLVDTNDGGVVWGDRFVSDVADVLDTRTRILSHVVAALEVHIPMHEARAARLVSSENLDAWAAYHLGLQHMFRFHRADNAAACGFFERATAEDPSFARAYAGLSFVSFQDAFLRYVPDTGARTREAHGFAERAVDLDPLDQFANLTMGRSFWLDGDLESSLPWLERATSLSPNYAQAIYARAWTHALSGRAAAGRTDADSAMALSPLDPLGYAMAATRALAHLVAGEDVEAAAGAEKAARSPGAHVLISVIAAGAHAIAGDRERARAWAANARERDPAVTQAGFFRSFPFADAQTRDRFARALAVAGI